MATQRPLREMIDDIVDYIEENKERLEYNNRLTLIHDGQLHAEVIKSMQHEFSPATIKKIQHRIPCINILVKIIDKLSKIYNDPVKRYREGRESDNQIIDFYTQELKLNSKMSWANRMYNLHQYCAIEPYVDQDGCPQIRVLSADNFLMYSDDPYDPTNPTVFIKFMGDTEAVRDESRVDSSGNYSKPSEQSRIAYYWIYSDSEFYIIDDHGNIRNDLKPNDNSIMGVNPLGRLPVVYVNQSPSRLIPLPDTDSLENVVLIPKLLGDLNYAVKYLSHSILVARDIDLPEELGRNPDEIWDLKSSNSQDGGSGNIDVLTPKVDIDAVLRLIQSTLATWLESKNIRPGAMGNSTATSRVSALAKIVDEADAMSERKIQASKFEEVEKELFDLIKSYHEKWKMDGGFKGRGLDFSKDFELNILFSDQKPYTTERQRTEQAQLMVVSGLASRRQAVRLIYPNMTETELDKWMEELNAEPSSQIEQSSEQEPKEFPEPQ